MHVTGQTHLVKAKQILNHRDSPTQVRFVYDTLDTFGSNTLPDDVFGLTAAVSPRSQAITEAIGDLKTRVLELRRRLRVISIKEVASSSTDHLPSVDQWRRMDSLF